MGKVDHRRDSVYERADRAGYWGSWIDERGKRVQRKLKATTFSDAKDEVAKYRDRSKQFRDTGQAPPSKDALQTVLTDFLKFQKLRLSPRSYERTEQVVHANIERLLGHLPMHTITRGVLSDYGSTRTEELLGKYEAIRVKQEAKAKAKKKSVVATIPKNPAGTVIREMGILKRIFSWLLDEKRMIPYNPAMRLAPPRKAPPGRIRYLQPLEVRALIAACLKHSTWLGRIVTLAFTTAMRRGEILGLRWTNVDLHGNRLMLSQTKNGDARIVQLNETAHAVLAAQWADAEPTSETDLVFPETEEFTADYVSKAFAQVCRELGISNFHFHDTRHTAASWMRMTGGDIHDVATQLGHKDLRMAKRYQHLSEEHMVAVVGRLDSIFGEPKQLTEGTGK